MGQKYTDEFLISELKRFYEENGRQPLYNDMKLKNGYPSSVAYKSHFGSWNDAIKKAGFEANEVVRYSDQFLLDELHRYVKENEKVPTQRDICTKNGYADSRIYYDHFGTWNNALELAGLDINNFVGYTKEMLIQELYRFIDENNRNPTSSDMNGKNGYPAISTYVNVFSSWNGALKEAGLSQNRCYNRDPEFLINEIYRFIDEFGHTPYSYDMTSKNGYPSIGVYVDVFGSWNASLIAADLEIYDGTIYSKETLLSELDRFVNEFDKVPGTRDMDNTKGYPSANCYKKVFGSWNNAILEAGYDVNTFHNYTKESLILDLQKFNLINGRPPYNYEFTRKNGYCSVTVYERVFGTWNDALKEAGLQTYNYDYTNLYCENCNKKINNRACRSDNGSIVCNTCYNRERRHNHPEIIKKYKGNHALYGCKSINKRFKGADGHHLHLENSTEFVVHIPNFLHQLHGHNSNVHETMITPNAIALDFLINEDIYLSLYLTGELNNA